MQHAEKTVAVLRKELETVSHGHKTDRSHHEVSVNHNDNADSSWRLQQLQVQHEHLQAKAATQDKLYKDSESKIEVGRCCA